MDTQTAVLPGRFDAPALLAYAEPESTELGYDVWRLFNTFRFYPDPNDLQHFIEVPGGFLSDGATVPRPFWDIVPPWGRYGQAAVLHDYLCLTGKIYRNGKLEYMISRAEVDKYLKLAMVALGVPRWKRNLMYIGVRVFSKVFERKVPSDKPMLKQLIAKWNPAFTLSVPDLTV